MLLLRILNFVCLSFYVTIYLAICLTLTKYNFVVVLRYGLIILLMWLFCSISADPRGYFLQLFCQKVYPTVEKNGYVKTELFPIYFTKLQVWWTIKVLFMVRVHLVQSCRAITTRQFLFNPKSLQKFLVLIWLIWGE